ncbi:MAG TPA: TonB family protein, partial [Sphingomicrobium sp.]|nr:TonB family protein [Sphingomicrobium sp.]
TANRPDRAKAIVAVAGVHVALAAIILAGLNGRVVSAAVETLKTFDVRTPPPPPPPPPPPAAKPQQMKKAAGAPAKKAEATPVVAPQPRIPVQSPIPAAKVAGTGSAASSGAGTAGNGTGAGGSGNGPGGGGYGGYTAARRISKIPDREYRRLAATGLQSGRVGVTIKVNTDGSVSNCRIARSSGDGGIDALMCELALRYIRFQPARDASGRPVAQDMTFFPNWWRP